MNNRTAPGAQILSQASRLDRLILAESYCDPDNPGITAYIGVDPSGVLSEYMLHEAEHVVVVSDVRSEVDRAVSLAVELQMREKIWARGIDGPINLDDFLQEYAKGHEPGLGFWLLICQNRLAIWSILRSARRGPAWGVLLARIIRST